MDAFGVALRQSIGDHLGHQQDINGIRRVADAFGQAANLAMFQSPGGGAIYAIGMRPELNIDEPLGWPDVEEHISIRPFVGANNEAQHCPIEKLPSLELRVGGRLVRFAEASRVMCASCHHGRIMFYYIFEEFIPTKGFQPAVELVAIVIFTLTPAAAEGLSMDLLSNEVLTARTNPVNFTSKDLRGAVQFEHICVSPNFSREDNDEGSDDDVDDPGERAEGN